MNIFVRLWLQALILVLATIFWGPILMDIYENLQEETMRPYQWPFLFGMPSAYILLAIAAWRWMK